MGRGDIKSKRGKIFAGSFGKARPAKVATKVASPAEPKVKATPAEPKPKVEAKAKAEPKAKVAATPKAKAEPKAE